MFRNITLKLNREIKNKKKITLTRLKNVSFGTKKLVIIES